VKRAAMLACLLGGCLVDPKVGTKGPPCAPGYRADVTGTYCLPGDAMDGAVLLDAQAVDVPGLDAPGADASADSSAVRDAPSDGGGVVDLTDCVIHLAMEEDPWTAGVAGQVLNSCRPQNSGRVLGAATVTVATGVLGRAGRFTGGSCIKIDDAPELRPTNAVTVAAWVHPTGLARDNNNGFGIVAKRTGTDESALYTLFAYGSTTVEYQSDIANNRWPTGRAAENGSWVHVAMVWDGSSRTQRLYVDGALIGMRDNAPQMVVSARPDAPIAIGCLPYGGAEDAAQSWVGLLDEVYVFHRPLADSEVRALYQVGHDALSR
jgi:Concanavalin A-like lectin/glucanases superfamily